MANNKTIVTKACKPAAFGDAKNSAVRHLLGCVSGELFEKIDDDYLQYAAGYFNYKCPYTDEDISFVKNNDNTGLNADHIIPNNKEYLGLTIKGNILLVTKDANNKKGGKTSIDDFMINHSYSKLGTQAQRKAKLKKIMEFQKEFYYDAKGINNVLKPFIDNYVIELQKFQEEYVTKLKKELYRVESVILMRYNEYAQKIAKRKDGSSYSPNSCKAYTSSIKTLFDTKKATVDDLLDPVKLDVLITDVSNKSSSYYKSGNTSAALKIFKEFAKTI